MNILLVGSGGRENALAWKMSHSALVTKIVAAPGNPGIADYAECFDIAATDVIGLVKLARDIKADMVVIGPESALAAGLADALAMVNIPCFGPNRKAAQLESSKAFTKAFCTRHDIPTAAYATFDAQEPARAFLKTLNAPYVIKADGLAQGKGVAISPDLPDAYAEVDMMLSGRFGNAGARIVIEEFMQGAEASVFALCDGKSAMVFGWAQDHKRAFDGDCGPNTGGMGAYSPAPIVTPHVLERVKGAILDATVKGMALEGAPFCGVLFAGLMIDQDEPRLVEFNARFGDPECQVLMLRLKSDIVPYLLAAATGNLASLPEPEWFEESAICVVMAANGYPDAPITGSLIKGADQDFGEDVGVFHAGTKRLEDASLVAAGGRVLNVCARGKTLQQARDRAYEAVGKIMWKGGFYRSDIASAAL